MLSEVLRKIFLESIDLAREVTVVELHENPGSVYLSLMREEEELEGWYIRHRVVKCNLPYSLYRDYLGSL